MDIILGYILRNVKEHITIRETCIDKLTTSACRGGGGSLGSAGPSISTRSTSSLLCPIKLTKFAGKLPTSPSFLPRSQSSLIHFKTVMASPS